MNRNEYTILFDYICIMARIRNFAEEDHIKDKYDFSIGIISDMLHNIGIMVTVECNNFNKDVKLIKMDIPLKEKTIWKRIEVKKSET